MDLILFSGGHDSANLIMAAANKQQPCVALFVDYGQPAAARELVAAVQITDRFKVPLLRRSMPTPPKSGDVWLGRNFSLIGLALPIAMSLGCSRIVIGCTSNDHAVFKDCRTSFIKQLSEATEAAYQISVVAPLKSRPSYAVDGSWSCYEDGPRPCGACLSCKQD